MQVMFSGGEWCEYWKCHDIYMVTPMLCLKSSHAVLIICPYLCTFPIYFHFNARQRGSLVDSLSFPWL